MEYFRKVRADESIRLPNGGNEGASQRQTFRILFLLRKARIGKNGLAPILARISTSRLQSELYIDCVASYTLVRDLETEHIFELLIHRHVCQLC